MKKSKSIIVIGILGLLVLGCVLAAGCTAGGSDIAGDWIIDSSLTTSSMVDKTSQIHVDSDGTVSTTVTQYGQPVKQEMKFKKQDDGTYICPEYLSTMEIVDGKLKLTLLGVVAYYKRA